MNPFDLPGPPFLLFYVVLATAVHLLWRPLASLLTVQKPDGSGRNFSLSNLDPYLVAYLRGREPETARVAIISLLDRGLLESDGTELYSVPGAESQASRPLERQIVLTFAVQGEARTIFKDRGFLDACGALHDELVRMGYLPSTGSRARLWFVRFGLAAFLGGVAFAKIAIAIERGHFNVFYLFLLGSVAMIAMFKRKLPVQTAAGEAILRDLKLRFAGLEARAQTIKPGGATRELVLLAAIFGMAALPAVQLAQATVLFPVGVSRATSGSCGSSCGTSCSSSSCSGSSCGGGGCGGGCGGCGGG